MTVRVKLIRACGFDRSPESNTVDLVWEDELGAPGDIHALETLIEQGWQVTGAEVV